MLCRYFYKATAKDQVKQHAPEIYLKTLVKDKIYLKTPVKDQTKWQNGIFFKKFYKAAVAGQVKWHVN